MRHTSVFGVGQSQHRGISRISISHQSVTQHRSNKATLFRKRGRKGNVLESSRKDDDPATTSGESKIESSLMSTGPGKEQGAGLRLTLLGLLISGAVIGAASGLGTSLVEIVEEVVSGDVGWLGATVFIVLYAAATVLLFPASVLTLSAGALFGPLKGTALVSAASTFGATLAFIVSRYLARPLVEEKLQQYPKLQTMVKGLSSQGAKVVFLLRLSPLFPFNLLNYALGVTSIGLGEYIVASWAGMLPGTFAYVFLGGAGRVAADAAASGEIQPAQLVIYAIGVAATLAVTKVASDAASKALKESGME